MNEVLSEVYRLVKVTRRLSCSVATRLTSILPLVRKLDQVQKDLTALRKRILQEVKEVKTSRKPPNQRLELFKDVAHALEPAMLKKRDLISRLKEQGVKSPVFIGGILCQWKKDGLFNTGFVKGWYSLSPKGRNLAGLPPKPLAVLDPTLIEKGRKEIESERLIASLKEELQKARTEVEQLKSGLVQKVSRPKEKKEKSLSQLDLVLLEMFNVRPRKLTKGDVKDLLDRSGKTSTPDSLVVLLTKVGSKDMIISSGARGNKEYWLTPKGEARAKQILLPDSKIDNGENVDEFTLPYRLTRAELTEQHLDLLDKAYGTFDVDRQRYYNVPVFVPGAKPAWRCVWQWWGLVDDNITPEQPLLGHLLRCGQFPAMLQLPSQVCSFMVDGEKVIFDPSKRADDRILSFVRQNNQLPKVVT
jgi:hypothetical protein